MTENGNKGYLYGIVLVAVLGGLLFGYDTAVISGAEKGLQAFFLGATDFQYSDIMHGFTSSSALTGCIIGSLLSGVLATGLGRRRTLTLAGILFFVSALGSMNPEFLFFQKGVPTLGLLTVFNIYRVIGGMGVGLESIGEGLSRVAADSDPWTIETGWRYMFGSEAIPAALFAILICFVPESPRYLVMVGKDEQAQKTLAKINGSGKAQEILDDIRSTISTRSERLFTYGWLVVFIGVMLSVFQQIVGINAVLYYAPRIFGDMGMTDPMFNTVMMGVVNILFTLVAIFTVEKIGRKPLLIIGSLGMALGAFGVALTFGQSGLELVTMISIMLYSASFMFSWGPICWVLIAEIFPNTIRGAAVAIAVAGQWIFNFAVSSTFVPMFNMHITQGDDFGHWLTYGLYGLMCIVAAIFVWRLVPETKGKSLEEMSRMWK